MRMATNGLMRMRTNVAFRERGYAMMLDSVKDTLSTFGNNFDTWFSERSLFVADENGETKQQRAFDVMNEKGLLFEAEGATFFRSTDYGPRSGESQR